MFAIAQHLVNFDVRAIWRSVLRISCLMDLQSLLLSRVGWGLAEGKRGERMMGETGNEKWEE